MAWSARLLLSAVGLAVGVLGCGGPRVTPQVASEAVDTTLGASDVFEVRVYGEEELTGQYRVAENGTVDFHLIGRVPVEGLETTAVADEITRRLRDGGFLREPSVTVRILEANSKKVSVVGAVQHPGSFPLSPGLTVAQLISLAGGFTSIASANGTIVSRRDDGTIQRFQVPVEEVIRGRQADFEVKAGDIIFVPERIF